MNFEDFFFLIITWLPLWLCFQGADKAQVIKIGFAYTIAYFLTIAYFNLVAKAYANPQWIDILFDENISNISTTEAIFDFLKAYIPPLLVIVSPVYLAARYKITFRQALFIGTGYGLAVALGLFTFMVNENILEILGLRLDSIGGMMLFMYIYTFPTGIIVGISGILTQIAVWKIFQRTKNENNPWTK